MSDLIERQAAIDEIARWFGYFDDDMISRIQTGLKRLPSAQADSKETSSTHKTLDTISRQAAIDAILAVTGNSSVRELYEHVQEHGLSEMWSGGVNAAIDIIIAVPSAQPIIRCKDCYHYPSEYADCPMIGWARNENDFCSKAERKDDD